MRVGGPAVGFGDAEQFGDDIHRQETGEITDVVESPLSRHTCQCWAVNSRCVRRVR